MAIAEPTVEATGDVPGVTRPMTYEEYLASPEEMARYDILDGWKVYRLYGEQQLPNPTREHQKVLLKLARRMGDWADTTRGAELVVAPCDVAVSQRPIRTRQPDILVISMERLAQNPPSTNPAPPSPAPELVVEILSPSDKPAVLAAKLADYRSVDVREAWVVRTETQTVDVVRLSVDEIETIGSYGIGEAVISAAFDGLTASVNDIFTL